MSETERAAEIASGPRRRFLQNIAIVAAVVVALAGMFVALYQLQHQADTAGTNAVSLAEQVQERCDTEGSLLVGDRDLCARADDVAEDPSTELVPVNGRDGAAGTDGTDGTDGADGIDGKDGADGKPGKNGADGTDGLDGAPGLPGADGRGIESTRCTSAGWVTTYTDGTIDGGTGPCIGPQGVHGEQGPQGVPGTAKPGTYACPDGETMTGFTVAVDGAVTLACEDTTPPIITPTP